MPRVLKGQVVSNRMDKTVVVSVTRLRTHRLYGKKYRVTKKYFAHDPTGASQIGQTVEIVESRPLSRRKRWQLKTAVSATKKGSEDK